MGNTQTHQHGRYLIAGAGNTLMGDDGVGIRVVESLEQHQDFPYDLRYCGTDLLTLATVKKKYLHIIVIDAVRCGVSPGTIHWFTPDHLESYSLSGSAHQISACEALALLPLMNPLLGETSFSIVGIEPADTSFGEQLSPPIHRVVSKVVKVFLQEDGPAEVIRLCRRRETPLPG
ncbi:MAG: hydrogenase maturation protease [Candidatus Marinimicrobia bacterium]|nr:hydrogenase maturation protease [Candidatus Neomarinimicrobiota bacterium]MCF7829966.1 hydrogenase maturation protease [Candidatus Neomarinimicrobiota bacterium]MCF7881880.1 hydrogenase maturation protease [Candidatus Neomarinimicrobiota bacterium]